MQPNLRESLNLPNLRSNPFDHRPLAKNDLDLLVGRGEVFGALDHAIRFGSPMVVALVGEKGSGRTSLAKIVAGLSDQPHTAFWHPTERINKMLHEMYCTLMNDFDTPPVNSLLIERLHAELSSQTGLLPVVVIDFPFVSGPDLVDVVEALLPVFTGMRALTIITLTPGQLSAFSDEVLAQIDVTEPLAPFTDKQVAELIARRVKRSSRSAWTPPRILVEHVMDQTAGHPARTVVLLRNMFKQARGVPLLDSRRVDVNINLAVREPTDVDDETFQRVADASGPLYDADVMLEEPESETEEFEEEDDAAPSLPEFSEPAPEIEELDDLAESEPDVEQWDSDDDYLESSDFEDDDAGLATQEQTSPEPVGVTEQTSLEPAPEKEPQFDNEPESDSDAEFFRDDAGGAEIIGMDPATAPPRRVGKFGGLINRNRQAKRSIQAEPLPQTSEQKTPPKQGPVNAKPNEPVPSNDVGRVVFKDSNVDLWVAPGAEIEVGRNPQQLPQRPPIEQPPFEPPPTAVRDALANIRRPPEPQPAFGLDVNALMNLSNSKTTILEQALEREISPSDDYLREQLGVGRPRLSQQYNAMERSGILTARKVGRSRLFRISEQARDHLLNLGSGGESQ